MKRRLAPLGSEPSLEEFVRTPDQVAADRIENERMIERMKEADRAGQRGDVEAEIVQGGLHAELARIRQEAGARPIGSLPTPDEGESIGDVAAAALKSLRKNDEEKRGLPCMRAMFPDGAPDRYHALLAAEAAGTLRKRLRLADGVRACIDAKMNNSARCDMFGTSDFCAHSLQVAMRERTIVHLTDGDVPADDRDPVLAAIGWHVTRGMIPSVPLWKTDPMRIMRAFLEHEAVTLSDFVEDGHYTVQQVHPITGGVVEGTAAFRGHERLLVFGGNNGRGKTVAGAYGIGRIGGHYTTHAKMLPRRAQLMDHLRTVPGLVVIDQAWRIERQHRETATMLLEDVVHERAAGRLDTLVIGNFDHRTLFEYADRNVMERILGRGALMLFAGETLRDASRP